MSGERVAVRGVVLTALRLATHGRETQAAPEIIHILPPDALRWDELDSVAAFVTHLREQFFWFVPPRMEEQQKDAKMTKVAFDERFGFLVDAEWTHRENRRMDRILENAKLRINQACVEDIDYTENRHLDRGLVRHLATCRWVDEHHNIVIEGATGTGKTYIACALAQMACRRGYRVLYR